VLGENALRMHPHANGLVITADGGTTVKASSVGREFSRLKLEQDAFRKQILIAAVACAGATVDARLAEGSRATPPGHEVLYRGGESASP
jgi:hypothetical protein